MLRLGAYASPDRRQIGALCGFPDSSLPRLDQRDAGADPCCLSGFVAVSPGPSLFERVLPGRLLRQGRRRRRRKLRAAAVERHAGPAAGEGRHELGHGQIALTVGAGALEILVIPAVLETGGETVKIASP